MVNHPQNVQAMIDQRWHEARADVACERCIQAAEAPGGQCHVRVRFAISQIVSWRQSRSGRRAFTGRKAAARYATAPSAASWRIPVS